MTHPVSGQAANDALDGDLCPPEIEFDRAVDRLEAKPWDVKDWNMVLRTIRRIEKFSASAILSQQITSKPRLVG